MSKDLTFISVSEAAQIADVSNETMRQLCKAGTLRFQKRGQLYYPCKEDVNRYVDSISKVHGIRKDIERYAAQLEKEKETLSIVCDELKEYSFQMGMSPARLDRIMEIMQALLMQYEIYPVNNISKRELELLFMMFRGTPIPDAAKRLDLTQFRVRQIWDKLLEKLASTRNEIERRDQEIESLNQTICSLRLKLENKKYELLPKELQENVELLLRPISSLNLSVRAKQGLAQAQITNVLGLIQCTRSDIKTKRNMGAKSIAEIDQWLKEHNLSYEMISGFEDEDLYELKKDIENGKND